MRIVAFLCAALPLLGACVPAAPDTAAPAAEAIHVLPGPWTDEIGYWCLSPEGDELSYDYSTSPPSCPAPARFIEVAICDPGFWQPDRPGLREARLEAARDGSAIGDSFEGHPLCIALPPA